MITFLTGGARSGKSTLAVRMASEAAAPVTVIATAEPSDEEMATRIARHKDERPKSWKVIEEPLDLAGALERIDGDALVILDCLTLWVSNLMADGRSDKDIVKLAQEAADVLSQRTSDTIVVTNEVGDGLVPMDPLGRRYRDVLGTVNATFAAPAQRAYLVIAGRTVVLGSRG